MKRTFKQKLIRSLKFFYWMRKIENLEDELGLSFATTFNNTKRATMWYIATKDIDYAFYKVYNLWGVDSLTDSEKIGF